MSRAKSAGDEMRLALRAVRVALRHLEYARTTQRLAASMEPERRSMMLRLVALEEQLAEFGAECDASDAEWRRKRNLDPWRGRE